MSIETNHLKVGLKQLRHIAYADHPAKIEQFDTSGVVIDTAVVGDSLCKPRDRFIFRAKINNSLLAVSILLAIFCE